MLFHNISPLEDQAQPSVFIFHFDAEGDAWHFVKQNERWVLKSRASLLVKGFENPSLLGLPKHSPAALSVPIRVIRGSQNNFAAIDFSASTNVRIIF